MRKSRVSFSFFIVVLLAGALALGGCGSDGSRGAAGPEGPAGPPGGTDVSANPAAAVDTCVVCHGDTSTFSAREQHDAFVSRAASWEVVSVAVVGDPGAEQVVIRASIDDPNVFNNVANVRAMWMNQGVLTSTNNAGAAVSVVDEETGDHLITITPSAAFVTAGWTPLLDVTWRVRLNVGAVTFPEASVVAYQNERVMTPVSDQACVNCHGDNIFVNAMGAYDSVATLIEDEVIGGIQFFAGDRRPMTATRPYHFSAYGVESCVMCHSGGFQTFTVQPAVGETPAITVPADRLMYYAHGIHQSNMVNQINNEAGGLEVKDNWNFSVRYPGDNQNCSACHMEDADLTTVLATPVSRAFCGSCHGEVGGRVVGPANVTMDWDSFTFSSAQIESLHLGLIPTVNCQSCHDGSVSQRTVVGDFHRGFNPELRAAANLNMDITAVNASGLGAPFQVQWRATRINPDGSPGTLYNACNTTVGLDAPIFFGQLSIRIAYYQGDDIANVGVGEFGQPGATTGLSAENTVCDATGAAITTLNFHEGAVAERAQITFDGRPRITIPGFANQQARVPVPSFSFMVNNGTEQPRRQIVDTAKCIGCHLGNMYRHGGGRNDNIESCIACHNPSATDQGFRESIGIDASNSYDRKQAESFSMAYNMHAVHGVGERDAFYLVYRGRGLYGYGSHNTPLPRNWPLDVNGNPAAYTPDHLVFGSNPPAEITHYLKKVNFPNRLNNCQACHIEGAYGIPDQSKALAISMTSGVDGADQTDDVLMSPATGACMSCHQSGNPAVQSALRGHAAQFSWEPTPIEGGKGAVLEAAQ